MLRASSNVQVFDSPFEDRQCRDWLVEGHFMSALVDAHETKRATLPHLAVNDTVVGGEIDVTGVFKARCVDFVRDNFSAQPESMIQL